MFSMDKYSTSNIVIYSQPWSIMIGKILVLSLLTFHVLSEDTPLGSCENGERYCTADNTCIPDYWWCDAYIPGDCSDGEDERQCTASDCAKTDNFHCENSMTCTNMMNRCDGLNQCANGEDEENCEEYVCPGGTVKCNDNKCILGSRCDGDEQCKDGEDEEKCEEYECPEGQTKCDDHTCAWAYRCDGLEQCKDGTDEKECEAYVCPSDQMKCADYTCAFGEKCDGWENCRDGTDEKDCHEYECPQERMKCDDHTCAYGKRCNGYRDCHDGSDEDNCGECSDNAFLCTVDNQCIPGHYKCDSYPDCSDFEDDLGCGVCAEDEYMCSNGNCIDPEKICDDVDDCGDDSDERCGIMPVLPLVIDPITIPYYSQRQLRNRKFYKRLLMSSSKHQSMPRGPRKYFVKAQQNDKRNKYKKLMLDRLRKTVEKERNYRSRNYGQTRTSGTSRYNMVGRVNLVSRGKDDHSQIITVRNNQMKQQRKGELKTGRISNVGQKHLLERNTLAKLEAELRTILEKKIQV